jgi:hypothetical protein
MKYTKPEIVVLHNAINAVCGNGKGLPDVRDNEFPNPDNATIHAYEADE